MMDSTVYFAHAMTDYGSRREAVCLTLLREKFTTVINPSDQIHVDAAAAFKRAGMNAMDYFLALVRESDCVAYLETEDGYIGPGVAKEVVEAHAFNRVVFKIIDASGGAPALMYGASFNHLRILSIEAMRARVKL